MRFQISTLLLSTALICVIVGWIVERRTYTGNLAEATKRESLITSTISIAMTTNRLIDASQNLSKTEFDTLRRQQLFANVVFLYRHEHHFVDCSFIQTDRLTLRLAHEISVFDESGRSLALLGIESPDQFLQQIENSGLSRIWIDALLKNDNDEIHKNFPAFINRSIEIHADRENYDLAWRFPNSDF
jgi:hypothetical protein